MLRAGFLGSAVLIVMIFVGGCAGPAVDVEKGPEQPSAPPAEKIIEQEAPHNRPEETQKTDAPALPEQPLTDASAEQGETGVADAAFGADSIMGLGELLCDFTVNPHVDKFIALMHPELLGFMIKEINNNRAPGSQEPPFSLEVLKQQFELQLEKEEPMKACTPTSVEELECDERVFYAFKEKLALSLDSCGKLTVAVTNPDDKKIEEAQLVLKLGGRWVLDTLRTGRSQAVEEPPAAPQQ